MRGKRGLWICVLGFESLPPSHTFPSTSAHYLATGNTCFRTGAIDLELRQFPPEPLQKTSQCA
jgi:hypothetical protein